jgi:cytochrome c556
MEQVKATNKSLTDYRRMSAAAFGTKATTEIALTSHKMAVLTMAIDAHAPPKDPDAAKGQTRKAWLEATDAVRAATLDMAAAAKAKKPLDYKNALNKMDSACTKCHDVFRVEVN